MASLEPTRIKGEWVECGREGCFLMFYRHVFGDKCYALSDKIGVCPLCVHTKKVINGTLTKKEGNVTDFIHHKGIDAKPESNSL